MIPAFFKNIKDRLFSRSIVYYLFPVILIIGLYFAFLPFDRTYIGDWHDIFANSFYTTLVEKNFFVTWNDLGVGGFPLTASPGLDRYYIFSIPFYLIFQNLSVVNYIMLLHLLIAYFAFYKFGSLLTKNDNALLVFSLFFAFSGMILGRVSAGHHLLLYCLAWIPLLYYFFFKIVLFDEPLLKNALGFSIVAALMYFTGDVYHVIFAFFVIFVFFAWYAISGRISKRILWILGIALLLALLLVSVKGIPDILVYSSIHRIDTIDPLAGGGSLENDIASFVSGVRIDSHWTQAESGVMIGIIPVILVIMALLYGRRDIAIPSFLVILFSAIWAGGGKTVLSFIHLFPFVGELRNPGRIFGATLPIVLFLSLYGAVILYQKYQDKSSFHLSQDQKNIVLYGILLLIAVKLLELPFQEMVSSETIIAVLLIAGFIALLEFGRGSPGNVLKYLILAGLLNFLLIFLIYSLPEKHLVTAIPVIVSLFLLLFLVIHGIRPPANFPGYLCAILFAGIVIMIIANLGSGYVTATNPGLEKSLAPEIIDRIKVIPSENSQIWVLDNGGLTTHMDFTYWFIQNNIHPIHFYTAYTLKDLPPYWITVGSINYPLADYYVDTRYLENGNQNIEPYSFKVQNISIKKTNYIIPTAFVIRNNQLTALKVGKYAPGDVAASGQMSAGDIVVLKTAYYPGWKANGIDATPFENMVAVRLIAPAEKISFVFDPLDYKIGAILSGCGIILLVILFTKRNILDLYFAKMPAAASSATGKSGRKRTR